MRTWLDQRQASMPLASPSPWLFPAIRRHGRSASYRSAAGLKLVGIECNQDRRAALLHLAGEIPAAVLSDIVGVHVNTAGTWADMAGRSWGEYLSPRDLADLVEPAG